MSSGELTNILVSTDVTRYLEFKQVAGSYVQQGNGPRATVAKVPSDAREALTSSLMGLFEKRRMKAFIEWVGTFSEGDPASHKGMKSGELIMLVTKLDRSEHEYLHHERCVRQIRSRSNDSRLHWSCHGSISNRQLHH